MSEETREVHPIERFYRCPKCGGEMKFTGQVWLTEPKKYQHECDKCNWPETFTKRYPYLDYQ